jgi:hypothetical protein
MSIEIQKPELELSARGDLRSGRFHVVDDLLTKALDARSESSGGAAWVHSAGQFSLADLPGQFSLAIEEEES